MVAVLYFTAAVRTPREWTLLSQASIQRVLTRVAEETGADLAKLKRESSSDSRKPAR